MYVSISTTKNVIWKLNPLDHVLLLSVSSPRYLFEQGNFFFPRPSIKEGISVVKEGVSKEGEYFVVFWITFYWWQIYAMGHSKYTLLEYGEWKQSLNFSKSFIKCSSYCERYDWSVWVHYSSIKHSAYVTRVHYNSTYARKLRHQNFALDKFENQLVRHYGWRISLVSTRFWIPEHRKK